ncbi:MAG TPA: hypothetical protein VEW90_07880 [Gaiellaceae bacterium]|nr:hypothetical protein [Gaiellaceae bacterium]
MDRERHECVLGLERDDERLGGVTEAGVVKQPGEVEHICVAYRKAGEKHLSGGTPATRS